MRTTRTNPTHDDRAASGGFVLWMMVYATIMVSLFAFQDGGLLPSLIPSMAAG